MASMVLYRKKKHRNMPAGTQLDARHSGKTGLQLDQLVCFGDSTRTVFFSQHPRVQTNELLMLNVISKQHRVFVAFAVVH